LTSQLELLARKHGTVGFCDEFQRNVEKSK